MAANSNLIAESANLVTQAALVPAPRIAAMVNAKLYQVPGK